MMRPVCFCVMLDFINIGFVDVLDILLVSLIIFYVVRLLKGSQAMSIFLSIMLLYALRIVSSVRGFCARCHRPLL